MFTRFLASRPSGISKRTVESYHYTLDGFIGYQLTPEGINNYLNSLSCHNGKLKFYSNLKALCNWLYKSGYLSDNPMLKVSKPKTQQRLLPAISKDQLETLLAQCHYVRDTALLSLLWHSGMWGAPVFSTTWNERLPAISPGCVISSACLFS